MASTIDPLEAQDLVHKLHIQQSIQIAICSLLTYDALIKMDKEIKYFWTKHWYNKTNLIFFINRYAGILSALSQFIFESLSVTTTLCLFSKWAFEIGGALTIVTINYILMLRVVALWGNSMLMSLNLCLPLLTFIGKTLSIGLKTVIFLEVVTRFSIIIKYFTIDHTQAYVLAAGATYCGASSDEYTVIDNIGLIDWVIHLSVSSILLVLALYRTAGMWRSSGDLVHIIIRDQLLFYFVAIFCSVINIINYEVISFGESIELYVLPVLGNTGYMCLLGSRILINLKEAGKTEINDGGVSRFDEENTLSAAEFRVASTGITHSDGQPSRFQNTIHNDIEVFEYTISHA